MTEIVVLPAPIVGPATLAEAPPRTLDEAALGRVLGALASRLGPLPKYLYPSAGTLYPVQSYVVLRQRLGALDPGSYYYDPDAHALALLSPHLPVAPDGGTTAALLVLVAERAAIEPIYGEKADAFCLLEAGYISEALRQAAAGLELRDAGDPSGDTSAALATALRLGASHRPLVCLALEAAAQ